MKAVIELELMGYKLSIVEGPEPSISYEAIDTPADPEVAKFYLRALRNSKQEAIDYIRSNEAAKKYVEVLEQWDRDPDSANDADFIDRLAQIAIAGRMPFYEDGKNDGGTAAWLRWADEQKKEVVPSKGTVVGLPWEQGQ